MNTTIVRGRIQAFKIVSIATFLLFFAFVTVTMSYSLTRAQTPTASTDDFVTTWSVSDGEDITIPTTGAGITIPSTGAMVIRAPTKWATPRIPTLRQAIK